MSATRRTRRRPIDMGVLLSIRGASIRPAPRNPDSDLPAPDYILSTCGRATYKLTWEEIVALYQLTLFQPAVNTRARYNVCPTTTVDAILDQDGKRRLERMRWGLIPSWWSKPLKEMRLATFNARAETVATKPMFRSAFKRNRCLIPLSGYYEWQDTPDGKQPWYFTARDGSPALTIAGLWDEWQDKASGETLKSCTMLITEPKSGKHHKTGAIGFLSRRSEVRVLSGPPPQVIEKTDQGGPSLGQSPRLKSATYPATSNAYPHNEH
jgi:putative SOS response-associated peptidase YedK